MAKASGGQRESDGVVVVVIGVQLKALGAKGPGFGHGWGLRAGVMDEGEFQRSMAGTPQGGVISPLLSNIYLHALDEAFADGAHGTLVRYADDFVVACCSEAEAREAQRLASEVLAGLGLELHPEKTRVVDLREGREGFDFLGCHFHAHVSGRMLERGVRRYYLQRWPSARAMKRIRARIKALTGRGRTGMDIRDVIAAINPILRGWGNYFRTGKPPRSSTRSTATSSTVYVV